MVHPNLPKEEYASGAAMAPYDFKLAYHLIPVKISTTLRKINICVKSLKSSDSIQQNSIDLVILHVAWDSLEACWQELEHLRCVDQDGFPAENADRFVCGWQVSRLYLI